MMQISRSCRHHRRSSQYDAQCILADLSPLQWPLDPAHAPSSSLARQIWNLNPHVSSTVVRPCSSRRRCHHLYCPVPARPHPDPVSGSPGPWPRAQPAAGSPTPSTETRKKNILQNVAPDMILLFSGWSPRPFVTREIIVFSHSYCNKVRQDTYTPCLCYMM